MPRRAVPCLVGAAVGVALLLLIWIGVFHVAIVQRADQATLTGFAGLAEHSKLRAAASFIAHLCDPSPYVYFAAAVIVLALVRRRFWVATAIAAIILGANETKPLLAEPRAAWLLGGVAPVGPSSWPSGHATAAMSLALCLVIAVPARARPAVAALGAMFAVAVSYSFLALEWHYPSDVLGGFLVAAIWTLLGAAAVFAVDARGATGVPTSGGERSVRIPIQRALAPPAAALLGAVALAALVLLARPHQVVAYVHLHHAFVLGAAAIGALGLILATGLMLALRPVRAGGGSPLPSGSGQAATAAPRRR
jgi:membrane-associated phospholipid phosphatase